MKESANVDSYPYLCSIINDGGKRIHRFKPISFTDNLDESIARVKRDIEGNMVMTTDNFANLADRLNGASAPCFSKQYLIREYIMSNREAGFNANIHFTVAAIMERFNIRNNSDAWKVLESLVDKGYLRKVSDPRFVGPGRPTNFYYYTNPDKNATVEEVMQAATAGINFTNNGPMIHRTENVSLRKFLYDNVEFFVTNPECFNVPFITKAARCSQHHAWSMLTNFENCGLVTSDRDSRYGKSRITYKWTDLMRSASDAFGTEEKVETFHEETATATEVPVKTKQAEPVGNPMKDSIAAAIAALQTAMTHMN